MLVKLVILLDFTKHKLCPKKNTSPFKNQTNVTLMDFMDMLSAPKAMTMVLDLDETLIHHTLTPPTVGKYKTLQFKPVGADSWITFYVQKRIPKRSIKRTLKKGAQKFFARTQTGGEKKFVML